MALNILGTLGNFFEGLFTAGFSGVSYSKFLSLIAEGGLVIKVSAQPSGAGNVLLRKLSKKLIGDKGNSVSFKLAETIKDEFGIKMKSFEKGGPLFFYKASNDYNEFRIEYFDKSSGDQTLITIKQLRIAQ